MFELEKLQEMEIDSPEEENPLSAAQVSRALPFPPHQLIFLFSPNNWEVFISEWAHYQKTKYALVTRLGGSNDFGVDVACFKSKNGFLGSWDNFQCKHYKEALTPSIAIPEIGKILWHIYKGRLTPPDNYYYFAPLDVGPSLKKLLLNSSSLKKKLKTEWGKWCSKKITTTETIELTGEFLSFVEGFDFSIFQYKPHLEVIDEHRKTPYFIGRFGGGLKERPDSQKPPFALDTIESRYIEQLFDAYSEKEAVIVDTSNIQQFSQCNSHLNRSRETFYEAESLKAFARDSVPHRTFDKLQDQVFAGVKDVEEDDHDNAFKCVKEVVKTAASLNVNASGLIDVIEVKDLQGICHQLANDDRLSWMKK